ncbi:MAG TPA: hypothetical protein VHW60_13950 [Caulobacteraceae bacterium]|jgi:hypothetical protein|nr:hypothetical protein [Caulobacteraceae bacterium]
MTNITEVASVLNLEIDGKVVDGRTQAARNFKKTVLGLAEQLGRHPNQAQQLMLKQAATLAVLCDRDTAKILQGEGIDENNFRRNTAQLGALLIRLGLALMSRDISKKDRPSDDMFADALNASFEPIET